MSGTAELSVAVVDDEPLARALLRRYLDRTDGLAWVGEAGSGPEAVALCARLRPDALLLDVEMPGMDGFATVLRLRAEATMPPAVVFVTAYDRYAVRAFEINAVDYLLKPVSPARFARAAERLRVRGEPDRAALERLLEDVGRLPPRRLLVREAGAWLALPLDEIAWIEADGDYVRVHDAAGSRLLSLTLRELARRLAARGFLRVHRGAVVNLAHVRTVRPLGSGRYEAVLASGTAVTVSRSHARQLRAGVERLGATTDD